MRKVKVITDSCADLNVAQLKKYDIAFAKMSTSCDGVESVATLSWTEDEVHALYNKMRDGKRIITAQVSVEEFQRVFEEYLKQNMDIVYIGCSSKQSGSVNTGFVTAKKLMEKEGITIKEVAEQVGFTSDIHFIRIFKKYENITPGVYKRQNKV